MIFAVVSGFLTALAFPKFEYSFLAWISLLPLFYRTLKRSARHSFRNWYMAGVAFYGLLLYWIPDVPAHYSEMPYFLCLLIYFALIGFLALYWGLFGHILGKIANKFQLSFLLAPFIWAGIEFLTTHLFTGFPWGLLGNSQYKNLAFIQTSSIAGVYAVSFLIVLFQSALAMTLISKKRHPFLAACLFLAFVYAWGVFELNRDLKSTNTIKTAVIQGNVSSDIYWNMVGEEEIKRLFEEHHALSSLAVEKGAKIIIWPEFTVPLCFSCREPIYRWLAKGVEEFIQEKGVTMVVGTNETAGPDENPNYYNTAMTIHPDLNRSLYFKIHLVPFGEYTPYKKIFFFIEKLTHAIGDITPGKSYVLHRYNNWFFASPICYEIIFPALVRRFVAKGANFLVTITNDGWYGRTSAPPQHWAQAVFRAVENRRFLARAATTGVSGFVDPYGRILAQSELMTKTYLVQDIRPLSTFTFYTKYGDWLPGLGLTLAGLFYILSILSSYRGKCKHDKSRQNL